MEGSAQYFRRLIPRYLFTGIPVTTPRTHSAARAHRRRRPLVRLAPRAAGRDAGTCYSTALIVEASFSHGRAVFTRRVTHRYEKRRVSPSRLGFRAAASTYQRAFADPAGMGALESSHARASRIQPQYPWHAADT